MRTSAMLGMLLAASASFATQGKALPAKEQSILDGLVARLPGSDGKTRRSKVKPNRPAKKTNRYNVSARKRRAHRRAA